MSASDPSSCTSIAAAHGDNSPLNCSSAKHLVNQHTFQLLLGSTVVYHEEEWLLSHVALLLIHLASQTISGNSRVLQTPPPLSASAVGDGGSKSVSELMCHTNALNETLPAATWNSIYRLAELRIWSGHFFDGLQCIYALYNNEDEEYPDIVEGPLLQSSSAQDSSLTQRSENGNREF